MKLTKKMKRSLSMNSKHSETIARYKNDMTVNYTMAAVLITLRDEFGFGEQRLRTFSQRTLSQLECMAYGYVKWNEILDVIAKETRYDWREG